MSKPDRLRTPLGAAFDDRLPEGRVHRLWQRIEGARSRRSIFSAYSTGAIAFAAALLVAFAVWFARSNMPSALRLAGGGDVPSSLSAEAKAAVAFDDGSSVMLAGGARFDVLESNGRLFELAQRKGTAVFDVRPGGPRTWRIECGGVTVEVVGTHFSIQRDPAWLRVSVSRGAVIVRGERVPDKVVRVGAGQSLAVPLADATASAPAKDERVAASGTPGAPASTSPRAPPPPHESPRPEPQVESAPAPQSAAPPPTLDTVLHDADAARREGRFADAARLLTQSIAEHAGDPRVALAEFSLGRLHLDSLGDASRAASHFERAANDARLPATLREDALARLVEARARASDSAGAAAAATRYRALYPAGSRAADVERWASSAR